MLEYSEMNTGGLPFNEWSVLGSVVLIWLLCSQESAPELISQLADVSFLLLSVTSSDMWQLCIFLALCQYTGSHACNHTGKHTVFSRISLWAAGYEVLSTQGC